MLLVPTGIVDGTLVNLLALSNAPDKVIAPVPQPQLSSSVLFTTLVRLVAPDQL